MPQRSEFPYDVFLSHSAKDKAVVRPLAERLRADGLKVWFDEWEIKPGDSIPAKTEEGLEHSNFGFRISDFGFAQPAMSANVFGSDWAQLRLTHSQLSTLNHQPTGAPLNQERRFIPLRLDDVPSKGALGTLARRFPSLTSPVSRVRIWP
jgi:hypothetical protein